MDYYDAAYPALPPPAPDFVVPYEYHGHDMNNYPGIDQGIPVEVVDPPAPEIDIFDYAGQHAPGGLAPAFVDELPHQAHMPVMIEPATEILRRLASHLNQPDSQVGMIRMEPGLGGGVRVVITLELAELI